MIVVRSMVEGITDVPMVERLIHAVGADVGRCYAVGGKSRLDQKIPRINGASRRHDYWLVLRDLDRDDHGRCHGVVVGELLRGRPISDSLILRIAVRSMESWLLADRAGCARFLHVGLEEVPSDPDLLEHPKHALLDLARTSGRREIRSGLPPATGERPRVGPRYAEFVGEFLRDRWNPERARLNSPSLDRALTRLAERVTAWQQ